MYLLASIAILISLYSLTKTHKTMATQEQLVADLTALTAQVTKIGTETSTLLTKVADLEAALSASGAAVTPEVEAALAALKSQVQVVDDLVPDAPTAETPAE